MEPTHPPNPDPDASPARRIHRAALVIDGHADTPQRFLDEGWDFTTPRGNGMISLDSARAGNVAAEFFAIWVDPREHAGAFARRAFALTHAVLDQVHLHPESLQLCLTPDDITATRASGRFGVLLGLEGGHSIENSLDTLREFHRLGVRYMTLTWSNNNDWADSSGDTRKHNGLTEFGRDVVREMNRLGMMIDVSHASDQTFDDVLAISSTPVIASHSSARALASSPRNLTDAQLRAIAQQGGVAMVNFFPAFIDDAWNRAWEHSRDERESMHETVAKPFRAAGRPVPFHASDSIDRIFASRIPRPPFQSLIDHFDHMLRVAGVDHVGIGSDFDGIPALPAGIDSAADLPRITEALLARGYQSEDLSKVLGLNILRVFRQVQGHARQTATQAAA